jgi:diguanylate cyclase (GGDEF)-like protein
MNARRSLPEFNTASIRRHYMAALMIVGMLAVVGFVTMQIALLTHEFNLRLSALGNEQMSLFQRAGTLTRNLLQAAGDTDAEEEDLERLRTQLLETTHRLIDSHNELLRLDNQGVLGLLKPNVAARYYYDTPYELDRKLKEFVRDAEFLARSSTTELRRGFSSWAPVMLTMARNGTMIRGFDEAMAAFEQVTTAHIAILKRILWAVVLLTIATLALEAAFIFKPLVNRLRSEHDKLYRSQRELDHLAHHDALTGLANRARFHQVLEEAIAQSRSSGRRVGVMLLDLDRFKQINDAFGHAAGDAVLVAVANRLNAELRQGDIAARLGGDEFALLLRDFDRLDDLTAIAHRVLASLRQPLDYDRHELRPSGSFGCSAFPDHALEADALLKLADLAMYAAKAADKTGGSPIRLYDAAIGSAFATDPLEQDLRRALAGRELVMHYQPKLGLRHNSHEGFEALVRWQHPEKGLLMPGAFLPLAERLHLMRELTTTVLACVAADLARWRTAGIAPGPIAINMPEVMLAHGHAASAIDTALAAHGLPWDCLAVEITEDVFLDRRSADQICESVEVLRRKGIKVAFDDFGTGHASLTHLRSFPFDEIKIDRSFIHDLGTDIRCDLIVHALIQLGQGLNKSVVAEGVETEAQEFFLIDHGCTLVQGFRYARPMDFDAATRWLASPAAGVAPVVPMLAHGARAPHGSRPPLKAV